MSDQSPVRALLIKDGDDYFLRTLGSDHRVQIALFEVTGDGSSVSGKITPLIPGKSTAAEADALMDLAKADMDKFVESGNFDREREINRKNREIQRLSSLVPPAANVD